MGSVMARLTACVAVALLLSSACSKHAEEPAFEKRAHVNGVDLHYIERGSGAPVVLIRGSLADYSYWETSEQLSRLADRHRVIAYSRRYNHPNRNPRQADHSPMVEAADLAAFLGQVSPEPIHVVGHSYGAYTALVYALAHPERVRSLVLAEPPIISWLPDVPDGEGTFEGFMAGVWEPLGQAFAEGGDAAGLDFTARWYFGVPWESVSPVWQKLFSDNVGEWHALAVSAHTFPALDFDRIRALEVPTLLLSGGANQGFNVLVDAQLERLLPDVERVTLPDASHEMFLDDPSGSAGALLDFFSRH